jgi:hypothetical protein
MSELFGHLSLSRDEVGTDQTREARPRLQNEGMCAPFGGIILVCTGDAVTVMEDAERG